MRFSRGLVREVLKSKNGCRDLKEARDVIKRYELQNESLTRTIEQMSSLEIEHETKINALEEALEKQKENYRASRKSVLSVLGEKMHLYDYR